MCTAITYKTDDSYFGRTLDGCFSFGEEIVITPRRFPFIFRNKSEIKSHYAIIGTALVKNNYPLYFDSANEYGLAMAGLNFPENAVYYPEADNKDNIPPFEFIPWVLSQCKNLDEARKLLRRINLWNISFCEGLPLSPLHWIIADKENSITVESLKDGIKIYENPIGVLTNNPVFDYHMSNLAEYVNLTNGVPENRFSDIPLKLHSLGFGAKGLPGDNSSSSRFIRAAFNKAFSDKVSGENESVGQFFHIFGSVCQVKGCTKINELENMFTQYTSCINLDKGIYYYTTYSDRCISAVYMNNCNLDRTELIKYPFEKNQFINVQN